MIKNAYYRDKNSVFRHEYYDGLIMIRKQDSPEAASESFDVASFVPEGSWLVRDKSGYYWPAAFSTKTAPAVACTQNSKTYWPYQRVDGELLKKLQDREKTGHPHIVL